ncbi:MAG: radical SAM protein [bacterium]
MKKQKILAVQLPAPCPLGCSFCRTPKHNEGDSEKVIATVLKELPSCDEVYLTSNGETGLFVGFDELLEKIFNLGKRVSVLCATKASVRSGLTRVEISLNKFTNDMAKNAIQKAKDLNIPIVISVVDDGSTVIDLPKLLTEYGVDGVLVRALQNEGRSTSSAGVTRYLKTNDSSIGICPIPAYREIPKNDTIDTFCIDHFGNHVPYLGIAS